MKFKTNCFIQTKNSKEDWNKVNEDLNYLLVVQLEKTTIKGTIICKYLHIKTIFVNANIFTLNMYICIDKDTFERR